MSRRLAYISIVAGVGLLAGFGGRAAWSAIPNGNTIHGCYIKALGPAQGTLRLIDASKGQSCSKVETPLDWAQTGAQGAQGIQGTQGAPGATGPAGPDGVSDYQIVSGTATTAYDSAYQTGLATATAPCPTGTVGTGGGFDLPSDSVSIWDEDGGIGIENTAGLTVTGKTGVTITAYTVCVGDQIEGK
jgi:hypothetical protein